MCLVNDVQIADLRRRPPTLLSAVSDEPAIWCSSYRKLPISSSIFPGLITVRFCRGASLLICASIKIALVLMLKCNMTAWLFLMWHSFGIKIHTLFCLNYSKLKDIFFKAINVTLNLKKRYIIIYPMHLLLLLFNIFLEKPFPR